MIPVVLASAPADFDARVRQKGLDAIAELVGEVSGRSRRGPKRGKIAILGFAGGLVLALAWIFVPMWWRRRPARA